MTDWGKIGSNVILWLRHDLLTHAPWLIAVAVILALAGRTVLKEPTRRWAIVLGALFYVTYVLILLPWSTTGHYSTPLGVFFAFLVAVLISDCMEQIQTWIFFLIVVVALFLNLLVGGNALKAASSYQEDSANFMKWLATNAQVEYETANGAVVRTNAYEPGVALTVLTKMYYGKSYGNFVFTPQVREILEDVKTRYYLYGTTWGDQDLSRLGKMWYPVFTSKNWVMFRRLY